MVAAHRQVEKLTQCRERLDIDAATEWTGFLEQAAACCDAVRRVVHHLATIDCVMALAKVARQQKYCRPTIGLRVYEYVCMCMYVCLYVCIYLKYMCGCCVCVCV